MAQPRRYLVALIGAMITVFVTVGCSTQAQAPVPSVPRVRSAPSPVSSPTPTPSPFPAKSNTGVPDGDQLTRYTGSCAFEKAGAVVQGKIINCDRVVILAADITIRASRIRGWIDISPETAHLTLEDSEVDAGKSATPAVGFNNVTVRRSEIVGGQTSVQCGSNCLIEDSLLHDQMKPVGEQHLGGYLSSGGSEVVLRHNTIACTPVDNHAGGGCTGSMQIFGDFGPLANFRFERNLVKATPGGFCASFGQNPGKKFGDNPTHIVVVDNVFERGPSGKCGAYGATTAFFADGTGNEFTGNTWDDGTSLEPNS